MQTRLHSPRSLALTSICRAPSPSSAAHAMICACPVAPAAPPRRANLCSAVCPVKSRSIDRDPPGCAAPGPGEYERGRASGGARTPPPLHTPSGREIRIRPVNTKKTSDLGKRALRWAHRPAGMGNHGGIVGPASMRTLSTIRVYPRPVPPRRRRSREEHQPMKTSVSQAGNFFKRGGTVSVGASPGVRDAPQPYLVFPMPPCGRFSRWPPSPPGPAPLISTFSKTQKMGIGDRYQAWHGLLPASIERCCN